MPTTLVEGPADLRPAVQHASSSAATSAAAGPATTSPAATRAGDLRRKVLVEPDELASALAGGARLPDGRRVRVLDVRWRLGAPDGSGDHAAGHVPGAVYVDLDTELAVPAGEHGPADGRHPLPSIERLQAAARRWGLDDGDAVVVYDDWSGQAAARAWWLLRDAGVADVRLLDGALGAWRRSGHPVETGGVVPAPGRVTLSRGHLPVLDIDAAAALPAAGALLDARAGERFRGEHEPVDPVGGHIPGAVNTPTADNLDAEGRFRPAGELRAAFEAAGARDDAPVGTYCGSGVTAAHNAVALTLAGFAPALYPGSWSQWSNTPGRPVETGGARPVTSSAPGAAGTADAQA